MTGGLAVGEVTPQRDVLLGYQQRIFAAASAHDVLVVEKSRRIGGTWALAAYGALTAAARRGAGGKPVWYLGYNLEMAREFIDEVAKWAAAYAIAAEAVEEVVLRDDDADVQAFRIRFASGYQVVALSSKPRSLRGKQGVVILDEAAFHDDLAELLKASIALLMWGGQVIVISTHDGVDNPFAELCADVVAGKKPYGHLRVTLDDALADGLYRRICEVRGLAWSADAERAWRDGLVASYGADADEELFCIPRGGGGQWLPRALIEARMVDAPVVRLELDDEFTHLPDARRQMAVALWCATHLDPLIARLDPKLRHVAGEDFGRRLDLSVVVPLAIGQDLVRRCPFILEMRNVPFQQQEQVVLSLLGGLPNFQGAAFDGGGNGAYIAERAQQRFGARVEIVHLREGWYAEHMPPLRHAFEDGTIVLPRDAGVLDDLRAVQIVRGVPRVPEGSSSTREHRHGDAAIALALAYAASRRDVTPIQFRTLGARGVRGSVSRSGAGWGSVRLGPDAMGAG